MSTSAIDGNDSTSVDPFRERTTYMERDYQTWSIQHQINLAPVDDDEESRLRLQHSLMKDIFSARKDPLLPNFVKNPKKVLDCGFGTGDWAFDVADSLPDCEVVAVDISPIMELGDMPENLEQEVGGEQVQDWMWCYLSLAILKLDTVRRHVAQAGKEGSENAPMAFSNGYPNDEDLGHRSICDLNETFTFTSSSFDFVHSRFVAGGIAHSRWPSYMSDIKRVLRSGGWAQFTEWELIFRSENGNGDRLQNLRKWSETYLTALATGSGNSRKSRSVPEGLETMLKASGYSNVSAEIQDIPTCAWSASTFKSAIGEQNLHNMENLLSGPGLYPMTSRIGITKSDFDALIDQAKLELRDQSARPYLRLYTCSGQKA